MRIGCRVHLPRLSNPPAFLNLADLKTFNQATRMVKRKVRSPEYPPVGVACTSTAALSPFFSCATSKCIRTPNLSRCAHARMAGAIRYVRPPTTPARCRKIIEPSPVDALDGPAHERRTKRRRLSLWIRLGLTAQHIPAERRALRAQRSCVCSPGFCTRDTAEDLYGFRFNR